MKIKYIGIDCYELSDQKINLLMYFDNQKTAKHFYRIWTGQEKSLDKIVMESGNWTLQRDIRGIKTNFAIYTYKTLKSTIKQCYRQLRNAQQTIKNPCQYTYHMEQLKQIAFNYNRTIQYDIIHYVLMIGNNTAYKQSTLQERLSDYKLKKRIMKYSQKR